MLTACHVLKVAESLNNSCEEYLFLQSLLSASSSKGLRDFKRVVIHSCFKLLRERREAKVTDTSTAPACDEAMTLLLITIVFAASWIKM